MSGRMSKKFRSAALQEELMENQVCAAVGKQLESLYPGYQWYVECRLPSGLIAVKNLTLDGDYGFFIKLASFLNETDPGKIVMRAGGEILERYNLQRGQRSDAPIERDFAGKAIGDLDAAS